MDETTVAIIEQIVRSYDVPTVLPSGHVATRYYASRELAASELARLAGAATGDISSDVFDVAVAAGVTGVFFVVEAASGKHVGLLQADGSLFGASVAGKRIAIVDDVACSGATLRNARSNIEGMGGEVVGFIVMVDRLTPSGELDGLPVWSAWQDEL